MSLGCFFSFFILIGDISIFSEWREKILGMYLSMTAARTSLKWWSHSSSITHFFYYSPKCSSPHNPAVGLRSSQNTIPSTLYLVFTSEDYLSAPIMLTHNASLSTAKVSHSFPWGISQTSSALLSFNSKLLHSSVCHGNLLTLEPSILAMTVDSCLLSHLPFGSLCRSRSVCSVCLQFTVSPCTCVFS